MSDWDKIGEAIERIGKMNGGPFKLYKPVVQIEWYDHDSEATVSVGRCKSMDEVVAVATTFGNPATAATVILRALKLVEARLAP